LNSQHKADIRARQTWFFYALPVVYPFQAEVFSHIWPGVHPPYNTRKGKVCGPCFVTVFKLPAFFFLEGGN